MIHITQFILLNLNKITTKKTLQTLHNIFDFFMRSKHFF